jgi:hypothetical protein
MGVKKEGVLTPVLQSARRLGSFVLGIAGHGSKMDDLHWNCFDVIILFILNGDARLRQSPIRLTFFCVADRFVVIVARYFP